MTKTPATISSAAVPDLADLTPYLSAALFEKSARRSDREAVEDILSAAAAACAHANDLIAIRKVRRGTWSGGLIYVEKKPPSWWKNGPEENHHHFLIVLAKGGRIALCASDSAFRDKVGEKIRSDAIASPVPRGTMASAFIGPEAKTAWLNGIHTPNAVKPDAKMLSGQALEYAIDPLGDHTYYLSALRSRPAISGLEKKPTTARGKGAVPGKRTVGAAPGRARVWLGRPKDWAEFNDQMVALLDHLAVGTAQVPQGLTSLAEEIDGVDDLGSAYALSILPPSLIDEDATRTKDQTEQDLEIAYELAFDMAPRSKGGFVAEIVMHDKTIGTIEVSLKPNGRMFDVEAEWTDSAETDLRKRIKAALERREGLKIYYDDGKTFAEGSLFSTKFVEAEFGWETTSFVGFDVHREKPGTKKQKLIDAIMEEKDNSLFDFVRKRWGARGMLACDDGSMELADFVHFDEKKGHIELIHVKAAGGYTDPVKAAAKSAAKGKVASTATAAKPAKSSADRHISVSDYEIVAAQAIKNVRHLDKAVLIARLKQSAGHEIAKATWIDGVREDDRTKLIAALERAPDNLTRGVTVLQPRLTEKEIRACRKAKSTKKGIQFNQLNALMLATRQAVANLGATFTGIADDAGTVS